MEETEGKEPKIATSSAKRRELTGTEGREDGEEGQGTQWVEEVDTERRRAGRELM